MLLNLLLVLLPIAYSQNLIGSSRASNLTHPISLACHAPDSKGPLPDEVTVIYKETLAFCSWENRKGLFHKIEDPRLDYNGVVGCSMEVDYQTMLEEDFFGKGLLALHDKKNVFSWSKLVFTCKRDFLSQS